MQTLAVPRNKMDQMLFKQNMILSIKNNVSMENVLCTNYALVIMPVKGLGK